MSIPALPPKPGSLLVSRTGNSSPAPSAADIGPAGATKISTKTDDVPKIDDSFLNTCSVAELQALLDNPTQLEAYYLAHHPLPEQYLQVLEDAERENDKIRARLEVLKPELLEKKLEVENALIQLRELELQWEQTERQMYVSLQPISAPAIQSRLQAAVIDARNTSESMQSSFLDFGPTLSTEDVQDFIKEYRQTRKTYHLRSARLARMKEERVSGFR